jgi:uncharacterized protein (TIGR02996 family)
LIEPQSVEVGMATTDDEAFIRAIVDAPGDDGPRLVYADWLDERGDPRGEYLRAELAAVRGVGQGRDLLSLANTLNPVWVCRISRWYGVCTDWLQFADAGSPLTQEALRDLERRLGTDLSSDYRAFLLNRNGGVLDCVPGSIRHRGNVPRRILGFFSAYPPGDPAAVDPTRSVEAAARVFRERTTTAADDYLPVVRGPDGLILLGVGGRTWGRVYKVPPEWTGLAAGVPTETAASLSDYLSDLRVPDEVWQDLVAHEDLGSIVYWLDVQHVAVRRFGMLEEMLTWAVGYRRVEVVRELLSRRCRVSHGAWELATQLGDDEIRGLLRPALRSGKTSASWDLDYFDE